MERSRIFVFCLGLIFCTVVSSCSDDTSNKDDSGPNNSCNDPLICADDCQDYVMDSLKLPGEGNESDYGFDLNNDGVIDNALGSLLALIGQLFPSGFALQGSIDAAVNSGQAIILMRIKASDFVNDSNSKALAWVGKQIDCCPEANKEEDPETRKTQCAQESHGATACFGGAYADFEKSANSTDDDVFCGSITSSNGLWGPSSLTVSLPIVAGQTTPLTLKLEHAFVKGTFSADKKNITKGVLGGGITQEEINNNLIPTVTDMLNMTLNDPDQTQETKDVILNMFDVPAEGEQKGDGVITEEEVAGNDMIESILGGDVDVTGDGKPELSFGVAFTAISGAIK